MKGILISLAAKIALDFLKQLAQATWDSFWSVVFQAIEEAERAWISSGKGKLKKEWAIDQIMRWVERNLKANVFVKWAIRKMLDRVIDAIIDELNSQAGTHWRESIRKIKDLLAHKIPFIV